MKNTTKKLIFMIFLIVIACVLMATVEGVAGSNYIIKSVVKFVLFLLLPALYAFFDKGIKIKELFKVKKSGLKTAIILSVSVYAVVLGVYLLCKNIFDFSAVTGALTKNMGVTGKNFIFVALYISFVNSLLEEFFFRGFAFLTLKRIAGRKFAYFFSAGVFAVYHIAMMTGWFKLDVFLIIMAGLFAGGLIFNYLNEKSSNIYPSWMVHMFANFAINTIGFMLFGII